MNDQATPFIDLPEIVVIGAGPAGAAAAAELKKKQIEDGDVDAIVTQVCTEQAPASPAQAEHTA